MSATQPAEALLLNGEAAGGNYESAAAAAASLQPAAAMAAALISSNGDEDDPALHRPFIGNFHKGLRHDPDGVVDVSEYQDYRTILLSRDSTDFSGLQINGNWKFTNPLAGLASDRQLSSPASFRIPPAPKVLSDEAAAEAVELYWMALLRDVKFTDFATSMDVVAAAAELSTLIDFTGPKQGGQVTPETIFRGLTPGDLQGPFVSQFMIRNVPYGTQTIPALQKTAPAGFDQLTDLNSWLDRQNGILPGVTQVDDVSAYLIRNMRDLAEYVHRDALYQAYLNACLILLFDNGLNAPVDPGNPYAAGNPLHGSQMGFGTFGGPHILSLVTEVATRALKAVWWQKWFIHRRLRPEAYGGLVHRAAELNEPFLPTTNQVLGSQALQRTQSKFGSSLLPIAFPEGSPTHPAYGAGHATVAGACVTILKAWFLESHPFHETLVPDALGTGTTPVAVPVTVGGELNKVAANIAIGRNMAGVHWRTDYSASIRLGELVALHLLAEQASDYAEHGWRLSVTTFDGTLVHIDRYGTFYGSGPQAGLPYLVIE